MRPFPLALILMALSGCPSTPTPVEPPPPPTEPPPLVLSKEQLAEGAENIALVPSPIETQHALESAGIETQLASLIIERKMDFTSSDLDHAAVRTGVVIADMLLTVKTSPTDRLLANLGAIDQGMTQLQGGTDIHTTIVDLQDRVKGEAITRDELLKELDELSGAVIPELEFNGQERVVPLIQAGSWLEGANLVAKSVKASGDPTKADALLKQPAVVDYFTRYVKTEGTDKAPPAISQKLETSLTTLKSLAEKTEPLQMEDIDKVIQTTDDVLALL
jgi:hypothetical protein